MYEIPNLPSQASLVEIPLDRNGPFVEVDGPFGGSVRGPPRPGRRAEARVVFYFAGFGEEQAEKGQI